MNEKLYSRVKTEEQRRTLKEEIGLLIDALYLNNDEFEHALLVVVRSWVSELLREVFTDPSLNKEDYLKTILSDLDKFESVSLILAFEPSEDAIDRFHGYISDVLSKKLLLDIVYEPQIIGGAIIIYRGEYRDFSFKKVFEREFEKGKENFITMLRDKENNAKDLPGNGRHTP